MPFAPLFRLILWGFAGALAFVSLLLSPAASQKPATYVANDTISVSDTRPIASSTPSATGVATSSVPQEQKETKPNKTPTSSPTQQATPATPTVSTPPPTQAPPPESFSAINASALKAVVNVICMTTQGGYLNPISASGVIIDPRGIVLTNAHVGQYLLLKDFPFEKNITCVLRSGSPAQNAYTVELMYLPPSWINENAVQITSSNPTGTGENDYAFLRITGVYNSQTMTLPSSFPFIPVTFEDPDQGESILVAGYPAGFLGGITITKELYSVSTVVSIMRLYTFDTGTIDLVSLGASIAAQKGVSGGAAVNQQGRLIGIETTASDAANTADRDLRAITIGHIDRSLTKERGLGLSSILAADPALFAQTYQLTVAPTLTKTLTAQLEN